jgi:hypothetical protein
MGATPGHCTPPHYLEERDFELYQEQTKTNRAAHARGELPGVRATPGRGKAHRHL